MSIFEFTSTGLVRPRLPEARAFVVDLWKAKYGENAQTSSDSPDGLQIDILSILLVLCAEGIEGVYANSFFRTAFGISLDFVLDLFARTRLEATASTASAVWYGDPSTVVPASSIASVEDVAESRFVTDAIATTGAGGDGSPMVFRINAVTVGNVYAIDVDGTEATYTAQMGDTVEDVAAGLVADVESTDPSLTPAYGGLDPAGAAIIVIEDTAALAFDVGASTDDPAEMDVFNGVRVAMTADDTGPTSALAGTLNTVDTAITGIEGVASTTDAELGRDRETDAQFKARHLDTLHNGGGATVRAIRANLLDEDRGLALEHVRGRENRTDNPVGGLPAHSFEMIVVGDATDEEIASVIYEVGPGGIQSYGTTVVEFEDPDYPDEEPVEIGLTRGTELYLWIDVTYTTAEGFPTTGDPDAAMEAAIAAYFGDEGAGELGLGSDFLRFAVGVPVGMTVPGIGSIVVTAGTTANEGDPMPAMVGADIVVGIDTILRVDSSRISVHT